MDETLLRRLVGAVVLFGGAFLLTWLLPAPRAGSDGQPVIAFDLVAPEPAAPLAPEPVEPEAPGPQAPEAERKIEAEPAPAVGPRRPSPPAAVREASPTEGVWRVQIGSFGKPENALAALRRMRDAGQTGEIQKVESGRSTIYRVRIGPYYRQEDARAALKTAEAEGFRGAQLVEPGAR